MRTTIDLNDEIFREAKKRAAEDHLPLRAVVEAALRHYLFQKAHRGTYRLRWLPFRGKGLRSGVNLDDGAALRDRMDGLE